MRFECKREKEYLAYKDVGRWKSYGNSRFGQKRLVVEAAWSKYDQGVTDRNMVHLNVMNARGHPLKQCNSAQVEVGKESEQMVGVVVLVNLKAIIEIVI